VPVVFVHLPQEAIKSVESSIIRHFMMKIIIWKLLSNCCGVSSRMTVVSSTGFAPETSLLRYQIHDNATQMSVVRHQDAGDITSMYLELFFVNAYPEDEEFEQFLGKLL
jgi:hypothetical protein